MTRLRLALLILGSLAALVLGFTAFQFLCDDAFIEFRYVRNVHDGVGFVWNGPPFRPVEGYTSFLWVALLAAVWDATGLDPTASALPLSLLFSVGTTLLVLAAAVRLPLAPAWEPHRFAVAVGVMVATLTNRAFLMFTSSGLETPMWTFTFALWGYAALVARAPPVAVASIAAIGALVRPDGLLLVGTTGLWIAWRAYRDRRPVDLLALAPFLLVVGHLLWRHSVYGFWVPNTYYAKHVAPWPVMGLLYAASFVWEFAYWPQLFLLVAAAVVAWRRKIRPDPAHPGTLVFGTVAFHWAYYTLDVGGDHFEYRVYHHIVPLLALLTPVLAGFVGGSVRRWARVLVACFLLGLVVPWGHFARTWDWAETHTAKKDRTGAFILPVRSTVWPIWPYAYVWDQMQRSLNWRFVGLRWHCHKTFLTYQKERWRYAEGSSPPGPDEAIPLLAYTSIGWPSWRYPDWYIIDMHGLSDVAVAHLPARHHGQLDRVMAHDRMAPQPYVRCFRPDLKFTDKGVVYTKRKIPLTAAEVRACEEKFGPGADLSVVLAPKPKPKSASEPKASAP